MAAIDFARHPELRDLVDAWQVAHENPTALDALIDLEAGPLRAFAPHLILVEREPDGEYRYLHYGRDIAGASGINMVGSRTCDFNPTTGPFFVATYEHALKRREPIYSANRAAITHHTHSWQRICLPLNGREGAGPEKVLALVRPLMGVRELLADFSRDTGFFGGTLEPLVVDERVTDFIMQPLSNLEDVFGEHPPILLSELSGGPLEMAEVDIVLSAKDGVIVLEREIERSVERFGRDFVLRVAGGAPQPVFTLADSTDLIAARDLADDSKQTMEVFARTASDWMWESDENHFMTYVSDVSEKQVGRPAKDFVGRSRFDFAAVEDNVVAFAKHRQDLNARRPFRNFTYALPAQDGRKLWVRLNGVPVFHPDGRFKGYRGTGTNITEEVAAKRALERQKRRMEEFASTGSDWLWESDKDHLFTFFTDSFEAQTGRSPADYIGTSRLALPAFDADPELLAKHKADLDARKPFRDLIYPIELQEGRSLWIRVSGIPRYDEDGAFAGYRGSGSNITAEVETNRALEEQRAAMEQFVETASDWLWETNADHRITFITDAVQKKSGYPASYYIGKTRLALSDLPENAGLLEVHKADLDARRPFRGFEYCSYATDGTPRWSRVSGVPRFAEDGTFIGYRGTGTNITEQVLAREQADRHADELAEAYKVGRLGAWWYDRELRQVFVSAEFKELLGITGDAESLEPEDAFNLIDDGSRDGYDRAYRQAIRTKSTGQTDIQLRRPDGDLIDLAMSIRAERDGDGRVRRVFGTVQDITARKTAERELERLAYRDQLTGLGNRAAFNCALDETFDVALAGGERRGLLLLDLDNFKEVNDTLGHGAGDELLRAAAGRLSASVGSRATVYRLGGDEFAVITHDLRSPAELSAQAASIGSAFAGAFKLEDGSVQVTTSIGMVVVPDQTNRASEAMRFADLALYRAKELGRNREVMFHDALDRVMRHRADLIKELRKAVRDSALDAYYQVQVDVITGRIVGFEALARWNHPERGFIPPSQFIPIAESTPLIGDIGAMMVLKACEQGKAWMDAGGAPLMMSVNVSVAQLWHRDVASDVRDALAATGLPPDLLCVELTESVFEDASLGRIQKLFSELKAMGVQLALDDFGTGYSSLRYLNALSFDKLKIDRSFVSKCNEDAEKRRLLQGIVGMAQGLGLETVVEGVETEAELQLVCDMGCNQVQGYYFAAPKPFHEACLDAARLEAEFELQQVLWKNGALKVTDDEQDEVPLALPISA
ncbi:MAG: EAL domain-containing protein [Devosiaceae bacterium]|nr:EAL domain-containing protein [Devosiaceae bacterium MH13]